MEYMSISQAAERWGITPRGLPDGLCLGHSGKCGEAEGCKGKERKICENNFRAN